MNTVELNQYKIICPASFDELKERDLIYLGRKFPFEITVGFYTEFLAHLCDFRNRKNFAVWFVNNMSPDLIETILFPNLSERCLFDFLADVPFSKKIIIPSFRHGAHLYLTYKDGYHNMSIGVFTLAETYFKLAIKHPESDAIDKLIACLYRPEFKAFLKKNDFILSGAIERRAAAFKSMDSGLKKAILIQYIAVREYIIKENKECFEKPAEASIFNKKQSGGWIDALYELSGHITQFEQTTNMNLWVVLRHIKLQMKKSAEVKAEWDRLRKK